MVNPYSLQPVEGKDFVGRENYYEKFQQFLEGKSCIALVTGERGIGKTSFLKNLLYRKFSGLQLFFIEYRTEKELEAGFVIPDLYKRLGKKSIITKRKLEALLKKLDALKMRFKISQEGVSFEIEKPEHAFTAPDIIGLNYKTINEVQHFLKKMKGKVVVLIENAHNLSPAEQKVFDNLVRSPNFYVIMEVPMVEMDKIVIRDCNPVTLGRLSQKECMEIIGKGHFSAEVSEAVYRISEGNPYYLQSICWLLYSKSEDKDTTGMSSFIETLEGKEFKDRRDFIHKEILNRLENDSQQLVKDLSIAPSILTHKIIKVFATVKNVDGALSPLISKGILLERDEIFWIYHSLFREFLRSEQRSKIATKLEGTYVKVARKLKEEGDCVQLLYELRGKESILWKVIQEVENEEILLNFGYEEFDRGRWETARLCFERGFTLKGKLMFNFIGSLGIISYSRGDLDEALRYYGEALEAHREKKDKQGEASQLGNMGLIYGVKGDLDEALKYHKEALEIDREIGYKQGEASQLGNMGLIYGVKGDLDEALTYLEKALTIFTSIGSYPLITQVYSNIFALFIKKNNPLEAFSYLKKALENAPDEKNKSVIFNTLLSITKGLAHQAQWNLLQHITTVASPAFPKHVNSFFTAIATYSQYKLSEDKELLTEYHNLRQTLEQPLQNLLDALLTP